MKKTAIVWSMCHIAKRAVSVPTNNACRYAKSLKCHCAKNCKVKNKMKHTPGQVQSRTFSTRQQKMCVFTFGKQCWESKPPSSQRLDLISPHRRTSLVAVWFITVTQGWCFTGLFFQRLTPPIQLLQLLLAIGQRLDQGIYGVIHCNNELPRIHWRRLRYQTMCITQDRVTWKPNAASELPHNFYEVLSPDNPYFLRVDAQSSDTLEAQAARGEANNTLGPCTLSTQRPDQSTAT